MLGTHNYKAAGVCFTTEAATIEEIEAAVGDGAEARIGANTNTIRHWINMVYLADI